MRSPKYTILIASRQTGVVRRFTIARLPTMLVVLTLFAIPVLMGLGARWSGRAEILALVDTNGSLRVENESYRVATGELATQISSLQSAMIELGQQAEIDPAVRQAIDKLPALVRSRAMGGGTAADAPVMAATESPESTFGILRNLLGVMETGLDSVRTGVERRQALAAATPSGWPVAGWLSSAFGNRRDPFTGAPDFHAGLDISANHGTTVRATADGTVESAGYAGNYGNAVMLDHGFGLSTRYGHLSRFAVRAGQTVRRGDLIGFVGATGRATSSHLHYEILLNGRALNPLKLLAGQ